MGCDRTASGDVIFSGKAIDFRVSRAESLILATEGVREMLFGSDEREFFAAAACDMVDVAERATG
jgi:hypothetical protein